MNKRKFIADAKPTRGDTIDAKATQLDPRRLCVGSVSTWVETSRRLGSVLRRFCIGFASALPLALLLCTVSLFGQSSVYTYSVSSYGMTGGTLTVSEDTATDGTVTRTVHAKSHSWASTFYSVDTTLQCVQEHTPTGLVHTVTKKGNEKDFAQNDVLILCPDHGWGHWTDQKNDTASTFDVPPGSLDMVCFFFNLHDRILEKTDDTLIMDGTSHAIVIEVGKAKTEKTSFGKIDVVPIEIVSKSPTLFVRNKPKNIRVSKNTPTVLSVDVGYSLGTARATLDSWTTNGIPIDLKKSF